MRVRVTGGRAVRNGAEEGMPQCCSRLFYRAFCHRHTRNIRCAHHARLLLTRVMIRRRDTPCFAKQDSAERYTRTPAQPSDVGTRALPEVGQRGARRQDDTEKAN